MSKLTMEGYWTIMTCFSKARPTFTIFLFQLGDHDKKQNPFPWTHLDLKLTTQISYSYIHILPLLEFLDIGLWCQVGITLDVIFQKWYAPWNFVDFSIKNVWMDTIDLLIVHFVELFCKCTWMNFCFIQWQISNCTQWIYKWLRK